MKKLSFFLLLVFAVVVNAQEMTPEEMQEMYMKAAQPGEQHEFLSKYAGEWNMKYTGIMPDGSEFTESVEAKAEMILEGRFLKSHAWGKMMGMDIESFNYLGYDTRLGHYTMWAIDTYGTYAVAATGKYDEETKSIEFTGMNYEMWAQAEKPFKVIMSFTSEDEWSSDVYVTVPGDELTKVVTAKATRK